MIASTATADLPVWRSPMISSRWPRPIGTMESIDFRPVCIGWLDRLAGDHARGDLFDHVGHLGVDRALAVDRLAQRVDHAADQLGADRHFQDAARALDGVAFGDVLVLAQDHRADRVALEVQGQAEGGRAVRGGREFQHFALHHVRQAVDAADAVGHGHHGALVADVGAGGEAFDAALDQFGNFCGIELHDSFLSLVGSQARAAHQAVERDFHLFQAGLDRGVEHLVADHHADAADQRRVFLHA